MTDVYNISWVAVYNIRSKVSDMVQMVWYIFSLLVLKNKL
jgi:hypothetical protein